MYKNFFYESHYVTTQFDLHNLWLVIFSKDVLSKNSKYGVKNSSLERLLEESQQIRRFQTENKVSFEI